MGKNIDSFTQDVRRRKWTELLVSCNNSGQSRSEWCKENGINLKTFYYWQHKLKSETMEISESHAIVPINKVTFNEKSDHKIVIRTNEIFIELPSDISNEIIINIIKAFKC